MNAVSRYTQTAVVLHWFIAIAMVVNVVLAWCFPFVGDDHIRLAIDTHKSIGVTVLGLALMRLLWRFRHQPPTFPRAQLLWEKWAASATHILLYGLIIAIPLSGWMHDSAWKDAESHPMLWFGWIPWPRIDLISQLEPVYKEHLHEVFGAWHRYLSYLLYGLFILHVSAALKHHFSPTQRVRGRGMLPG